MKKGDTFKVTTELKFGKGKFTELVTCVMVYNNFILGDNGYKYHISNFIIFSLKHIHLKIHHSFS